MPYSKDLVVLDHRAHGDRHPKRVHILAFLVGGGLAAALAVAIILPTRRATLSDAPTISAPTVGEPTINVAPVMVAEPWTETPLPIQLAPAELVPTGGWINFVGLPALAALSEGHTTKPGWWSVPVARLPTLKITAPSGARSEVTIALTSSDGAVLTKARSLLLVVPASRVGLDQPKPAPHGATAPPAVVSGEPSAAFSKLEARRRAQNLVRRGDDSMLEGNIATARAYYERAARMGWSQAALSLAATYDPNEVLHRRMAIGMVADPEAARAWYIKARELAHAENAEIDFYLMRLGWAKAP